MFRGTQAMVSRSLSCCKTIETICFLVITRRCCPLLRVQYSSHVQLAELLDELFLHHADRAEADVLSFLVEQDHRVVGVLDHLRHGLGLLQVWNALEILLSHRLDTREVSLDARRRLLVEELVVREAVLGVGLGGDGGLRRVLAGDGLEDCGVQDLDNEDDCAARVPDVWVVAVLFDVLLNQATSSDTYFGFRLGISTGTKTEDHVQRGLLLDVVIAQRATILELLACKDEGLPTWRYSCFLFNEHLDLINSMLMESFQCESPAGQDFDEDLHVVGSAVFGHNLSIGRVSERHGVFLFDRNDLDLNTANEIGASNLSFHRVSRAKRHCNELTYGAIRRGDAVEPELTRGDDVVLNGLFLREKLVTSGVCLLGLVSRLAGD